MGGLRSSVKKVAHAGTPLSVVSGSSICNRTRACGPWPGTRRARPGERVGGLQVRGRRDDLVSELVDVVFHGLQIGREGPDDHLVHARVLEALEIVLGR